MRWPVASVARAEAPTTQPSSVVDQDTSSVTAGSHPEAKTITFGVVSGRVGTPSAQATGRTPGRFGAGSSGDGRLYTIQQGDTFSSISVMWYGSERHWVDIAHANPLTDPAKLTVGHVIRLPNVDQIAVGAKSTKTTSPSSGRTVTHVVRPGESLYTIADRYYQAAGLWRVIFVANRENIGPDPDRLLVGTVLKIPPLPSTSP